MDGRVHPDALTSAGVALVFLAVLAVFAAGVLVGRRRATAPPVERTGTAWPPERLTGERRRPELVQPTRVRRDVYRPGGDLPPARDRSCAPVALDVATAVLRSVNGRGTGPGTHR